VLGTIEPDDTVGHGTGRPGSAGGRPLDIAVVHRFLAEIMQVWAEPEAAPMSDLRSPPERM
jgi:hypothetical protein